MYFFTFIFFIYFVLINMFLAVIYDSYKDFKFSVLRKVFLVIYIS